MNNLDLEKAKVQQFNVVLAYLLWWFLGFLGAHRLYTKQDRWWIYIVLGAIGIITIFILIGYFIFLGLCILWIIDGFKLNGIVSKYNLEILEDYEKSLN
jgi:TM2 domain-containing membrane protein YozV